MRTMRIGALTALAVALVTLSAQALAATHSAAVQVASSAMLVLDARVEHHDVVLRIVRTANHEPVEGAGNVTAKIDGHSVQVSAHGDTYRLATSKIKGGPHHLQVVVAHDGIHELLTGTITLPKHHDAFADLDKHGYGAWWILNLGVMLLAAVLIMRRQNKKKRTPKGR